MSEERLTIHYFGADMPWQQLKSDDFRRRNTCLLKGFVEHRDVLRVMVITHLIRPKFLGALSRRRLKRTEADKKVTDVYVCSLLPERRWLPGVGALNAWLMRLQIRWQGVSFTNAAVVNWCYWPRGFNLAMRVAPSGCWAFDADHNILWDPNESAGPLDDVEKTLRACAEKSDLVVAAARSILEWFGQNGCRLSFRLRNGVSPARFSGQRPGSRRQPQPRIGFVGMLSRWMDQRLLGEIAALRPQWAFTIAGIPHRCEPWDKIKSTSNVQFVGAIDSGEVPRFLSGLDVALGLYRKGPASDVDSMKLFEYLAAGVPVVTTPFHDFLEADFEGLLKFGRNAMEFVQAIETVLNTDEASQREWSARCREFVERNTWAVRADEAIAIMRTLHSRSSFTNASVGVGPP